MEITSKQAEWAPLAKKIRDRIEDPDDHANTYNLVIEGLWECERRVEVRYQSRMAYLERQVAASEARWRELRAYCNADLALVSRDSDRGMTFLDVLARMEHIDRESTADCVRVTVGPGGILLTPKESVMTHGTDTAFEYVMRVEEGEYHLVRLEGVDRG